MTKLKKLKRSEKILRRVNNAVSDLGGEDYRNFIFNAFQNHWHAAGKALAFSNDMAPEDCRNGRVYNFIQHFNWLLEKRKNALARYKRREKREVVV